MKHGILIAILVLTAWAYRSVLSAGFLYEDTQISWTGWRSDLAPRGFSNLTMRVQDWRGDHAQGFHVGNLLVHEVNTVLIWCLLLPFGLAAAVVGAVLWGLHPIQSEAVNYIAARPDLLLTTGILVACIGVMVARRWPRGGVLVATCGGLLAMWAKESGIVVLALLPLWLWLQRAWHWRWWLPWSLWALCAACGATRLLHSAGASWLTWDALSHYASPAPHGVGWFQAYQLAAIGRLLGLIVWPDGFTFDHDFDVVNPWLAGAVLVAAGTGGLWIWRHRGGSLSLPAFAFLWVLLALAPRLIVPLPSYTNEHQFAVAFLGICLSAGLGAQRVAAYVDA